jgi:hypothetical protein
VDASRPASDQELAALVLQGPNAAAEAMLTYLTARLQRKISRRRARSDGESAADLAHDCLVSILGKWPALEAALRAGGNLGGYLERAIENWFHDRQRARDPHGAAASRRWRRSIDAEVAAGVCECTAPGTGLAGATVRILGVSPGRVLDGVRACAAVVDGFEALAKLRKELARSKGHKETKAIRAFWQYLKAARIAGFDASEMLAALRGEFRTVALDDAMEPASDAPPVDGLPMVDPDEHERVLRRIAAAGISEAKRNVLAEAYRRVIVQAAEGEVDFAAVFASLGVVDRRRQHDYKLLLRSILGAMHPQRGEAGADKSGDRPSGDSGGVDD